MFGHRLHLSIALACALSCLPRLVRAEGTRFPGTRALGMGGALRAAATGDTAPQLNPSGMSLVRSYAVEGAYQYTNQSSIHDIHASVVDSTSGFNLGGGFFYSYRSTTPSGGSRLGGHEFGIPLSFPFLDKVFVGATGKYLRFSSAEGVTTKGFDVDAGITVRPLPLLSIAAVGYNLNDKGAAFAPRAVGGGLTVLPMPVLLICYDMVWEKVYGDPTRDTATYYMGGAELSMAQSAALRAGGGRDGLTKNTYFSAGFSAIQAQVGALDVGFRRDVSGDKQLMSIALSARLFIPAL